MLLTEENKKLTSELDKVSDSFSFIFIEHMLAVQPVVETGAVILCLVHMFHLMLSFHERVACWCERLLLMPVCAGVSGEKISLIFFVPFICLSLYSVLHFLSVLCLSECGKCSA